MIGLIIMCLILIAESIIEPKVRLTWPYGDHIPGGYIAKVCLPVFCVLVAIAVSKKNMAGIFSGLISLLSVFASVLTGERTHFLIRACGGMLAGLVWKPKFILYSSLILLEIIAVLFLTLIRPDVAERFGEQFINQLPTIENTQKTTNTHWGAWRGGIQQGFDTPIKGIGPSRTRHTCKFLDSNLANWLPGKNYCGNHPHNFYIQLFAETGIFGLIIGSCMFVSIICTCFKARLKNKYCPMSSTSFVIPFALFFPLQQFGSFYGQWGNLFIWFAIGFAISQVQDFRKKL